MQYTLRNVPKHLDRPLRERAQRENRSLNDILLEALLRAFGMSGERPVQRDLSDIAGTWEEDAAVDDALTEQRRIDSGLWR